VGEHLLAAWQSGRSSLRSEERVPVLAVRDE
jgi:hypothetical protein